MAQLLQSGPQKIISSKKIVSTEKDMTRYSITINGLLQKEVYEKLFSEKSKEVEIKGFRKGEAPREMVEQQIYQDVAKEVINFLVTYAIEELITDEKLIVLGSPNVEKVNFVLIETPINFEATLRKLPDYKIPDLKSYKVKMSKPEEPKAEEIEDAFKNLWEDWNKKATDDQKTKYKEPSDIWVKEVLKIPKYETIDGIKELLKKELSHGKLHQEEEKLFNDALEKILKAMKIEAPEDLVNQNIENSIKKEEENSKKYGISFQDFLKYYKKTEEEYRKETKEKIEKKFAEDIFWTIYIKEREIKIDPQDKKDNVFVSYAASSAGIKPDSKLTREQIDSILRMASMYKAVEFLRNELGFVAHSEEEEHNHENDQES